MSMDVVRGILGVLALSVAGAIMLRLLLCSPEVLAKVEDTVNHRLRRRRDVKPQVRPIQDIAVSIRRLGAQFHTGTPGRSWVKSEGVRRAYDDALAEGCVALEIVSDLNALEPGTERDAERLRVEHLLAGAGMVLRRAS
jgi:hypothetical protein